MGLLWLVIYCAYCVAFWFGCKLVRESLTSGEVPPRYDGGTILTVRYHAHFFRASKHTFFFQVFFAVLVGAFSLGNAAPSLQEFSAARGAAAFVFEVIDRVPPVDTLSEKGKTPKSMSGRVQFRKVAFAYPARKDTPILRSLSFNIDEGETVAFVGPSGYEYWLKLAKARIELQNRSFLTFVFPLIGAANQPRFSCCSGSTTWMPGISSWTGLKSRSGMSIICGTLSGWFRRSRCCLPRQLGRTFAMAELEWLRWDICSPKLIFN